MRKSVAIHPVKHPRYKWRVSYRFTDDTGKPGRRHSYFARKAEAEAFAAEKGVELANHGARHGTVEDDERAALVRFREWAARRTDPPTLAALIEQAIAQHERSRPRSTVREAIDRRVMAAHKRGVSAVHLSDLEKKLDRFAAEYGERQIADVTREDVEGWLHRLNVSPTTWRNYAVAIGSVFMHAVKTRHLAASPLAGGTLDSPKVTLRDPKIITPAQLRGLLTAAHPDIVPLLVLQAFCGVRRAEASRLAWRHIHLDGQPYVELPSEVTKTHRRRTSEIPVCAVSWLRPLAKLPSVRLGISDGYYRSHLLTAAEAAGIAWDNNLLRHSFGTYRLASTRNATLVAEEMGNSVGVVRVHYANVASPEAAEAWWKVEPAPAGRVVDFTMEKSS